MTVNLPNDCYLTHPVPAPAFCKRGGQRGWLHSYPCVVVSFQVISANHRVHPELTDVLMTCPVRPRRQHTSKPRQPPRNWTWQLMAEYSLCLHGWGSPPSYQWNLVSVAILIKPVWLLVVHTVQLCLFAVHSSAFLDLPSLEVPYRPILHTLQLANSLHWTLLSLVSHMPIFLNYFHLHHYCLIT